jgi:hypothetical protein
MQPRQRQQAESRPRPRRAPSDPKTEFRYDSLVSDYRDPRVGLRQRIEELEDRLGKLTEAQTRIDAPWKLGPGWAYFSREMFRIGRLVGRLIRRRRTNATIETGILRARIALLEERIILAESTLLRYRRPGKRVR